MKKSLPNHTISLMVANKPGVLVRIALVFSRRAFNIDSLVVSPAYNEKYSRMTITAQGDPGDLEQIIKQCNKLVDVIHAEEHNPETSIDKEFALVKVKVTGSNKTIIEKHIKQAKAKTIDTTDGYYIIQMTGDSEDLDKFELAMKKYKMIEMVRTGKVLIAKGKEQT